MTSRINYPHVERNIGPISDVVIAQLSSTSGHVLEIGCGSGQHVAHLASRLPGFTFWPSDPEPNHRESTTAWIEHYKSTNVMPPIDLDASKADWGFGASKRPPEELTAMMCFNVIHIAPYDVAEGIIAGAAKHLMPDGKLMFYGPYKVDGEHTAESNTAFDQSLQSRNSSWGIRDIRDIEAQAQKAGMELMEFIPMPANNFMPVFRRLP